METVTEAHHLAASQQAHDEADRACRRSSEEMADEQVMTAAPDYWAFPFLS